MAVSRYRARDDGRYANSPLHAWFDQLASGKGLCCSFADGVSIADVDWDTDGAGGHYRVRLNGHWIDVPDAAVVAEPNRDGRVFVWPYMDAEGNTKSAVSFRELERDQYLAAAIAMPRLLRRSARAELAASQHGRRAVPVAAAYG